MMKKPRLPAPGRSGRNRLRMLYLLTVADSMATGPKAWNSWTASLLRNSFKVAGFLRKELLPPTWSIAWPETKSAAGVKINGQNAGAIFDQMSPRYVLYTDAQRRSSPIFNSFPAENFCHGLTHDDALKSRTVHHLCKDRRFVFSKLLAY
ncbi:MAG: hypothetical protein R2860_09150 [Desulfobacterales bacterium]